MSPLQITAGGIIQNVNLLVICLRNYATSIMEYYEAALDILLSKRTMD